MRRKSRALAVIAVVLVAIGSDTLAAQASWGPEANCSLAKHCYAYEHWAPSSKSVDGAVLFQDTLEMDMPAGGDYANDEMWVQFGSRNWIETGQQSVGCCEIHRFWEYWIENTKQGGVLDPTVAPLNTYNHYEIYDPCNCGSWGIWWNGANPAYEGTEVAEIGKPGAPVFGAYTSEVINGMEVASETQPYNWGRSETAVLIPGQTTWYEWSFGGTDHSHQTAQPGQCVYRNPESGHWGNVEVSTCKCPKQKKPEGCSEHLAVIRPEESERPIYEPATGPLISSEAAAQIAATAAAEAGDASPTSFSEVKAEFGTTSQAVTANEARMPESAETAAWLRSPSYLIEMHGSFTAVPSKPGETPFVGSDMAIIVDARTGIIEGHSIGQAATSVSGLTPIANPGSARANAASVSQKGTLVGTLTRDHKPLSGFRINYQGPIQPETTNPGEPRGEAPPTPLTRTGRHGGFSVSLKPGTYRLSGETPKRRPCPSKSVVVTAGHISRTHLTC